MHSRKPWKYILAVWSVCLLYIGGVLLSPPTLDLLATKRWRGHHANRQLTDSRFTDSAPSATPTPAPTPSVAINDSDGGAATVSRVNPFIGAKLFVDPDSEPAKTAASWRASRPADAALMDKIASQPVAIWLGDWYGNVGAATKQWLGEMQSQSALPVFVLYNIPNRDCGSYSAGGASSAAAYRAWIQQIQNASAGSKAVFLVEPDALAGWECLSSAQQGERASLLRDAATILTATSGHYVYLDAGNANWHTAADIAARLKTVGTSRLTGIALNVSNFLTTAQTKAYGDQISKLTGGLHVVLDASRNGQGPAPNDQWCNPDGRGLGEKPHATPNSGSLDAVLWVKDPGESDGACNGGPTAGEWWPDYALGLAQRAAF